MRYVSVCSGIEAASCAWHPLGWQAVAFSEIDAFPSAVLAHHYPAIPNFGDMTKFEEWPDAVVDILVGGTPCQSFSVAGLRKGLDDPRGNLMLTYLAIARRYRPEWLVWENVPGVLSSGGGRDFGTFLGGLAELGYGFAYRVLDAQYFGVAQRRRRVFVVGNARSWRRAAAVLFERASLRGDSSPSRQTRERIAPTISARTKGGGGLGTDFDCDGGLIHCADVAPTLNAHFGDKQGLEDQHALNGAGLFVAFAQNQREEVRTMDVVGALAGEPGMKQQTYIAQPLTLAIRGRGDSHDLETRDDGTANAILTPNGGRGGIGVGAVAFNWQAGGTQTTLGANALSANTLGANTTQAVATSMQVRRLTPRECERLQGFPDDYTLISYRGKPAADGPRYKALGNSMAVPVMAWIGARIDMVEAVTAEEKAA